MFTKPALCIGENRVEIEEVEEEESDKYDEWKVDWGRSGKRKKKRLSAVPMQDRKSLIEKLQLWKSKVQQRSMQSPIGH